MKKPLDTNELRRLIDAIDFRRSALPAYSYDGRQIHEAAVQRIIDELVALHGAKFTAYASSFGGSAFKLAGIRVTCTAGSLGALTNWMAAARRAIAKLEGEGP